VKNSKNSLGLEICKKNSKFKIKAKNSRQKLEN